MSTIPIDRRSFLRAGCHAHGFAWACLATMPTPSRGHGTQSAERKPTKFQIACMTLPYRDYPLERALSGLKTAGYQYVCWYTEHRENGKLTKVLPLDAPPERAKEL